MITVWLPIIISTLALCFSVYMGLRCRKKEDKEEIVKRIERDTETKMMLNEINGDTKEIKETVKNIQSDIKDHEGRITKLEASYKAEHKRIDDERSRINELYSRMAEAGKVDRQSDD